VNRFTRLLFALLVPLACWSASATIRSSPPNVPFLLGLPAVPWPKDDPGSPERITLGRLLFYDGRLSANGVVSCAFCHKPEHGFSDTTPLSFGVDGKSTGRHSPALINRAWGKSQFWDGRAQTLEAHVVIPVTNPHEMGMTADRVVQTLEKISGYRPLFTAAFGDPSINFDRVSKAVATFERTIVSGNSAFDRYAAGDKSALTKEQKAGLDFFEGKGECVECHKPPLFTDEKFANIGIGVMETHPDPGRADVTHKSGDTGKFKVPTLRDLSRRGPYMHDGSIRTLGEVLDFYAKGGISNPHLDTRILKFYMDASTKRDLLAFLSALEGQSSPDLGPPANLPH
jgi:cytochrome c peroxidase